MSLSLSRSRYQGAKPYYVVSYMKPSGQPQTSRYTPHRRRAEWLFAQFKADVTDPASLADQAALRAPNYAACRAAWSEAVDALLAALDPPAV